MRVRVRVSEEDIKTGVPCNTLLCPIARAVTRALPGYLVSVDGFAIELISREGMKSEVKLPFECYGFALAFDSGDEVGPFCFGFDLN